MLFLWVKFKNLQNGNYLFRQQYPRLIFCKFVENTLMSMEAILDFLQPISLAQISEDQPYSDVQFGKHIAAYETSLPELETADLILLGCTDMRGEIPGKKSTDAALEIRRAFYALFRWHSDVVVADMGNVVPGATLEDTYAALRVVLNELAPLKKKVVILGGSHDLMLAQYQSLGAQGKIVEGLCIDAKMDMQVESLIPAENFLMEMFTGMPNYLKHYNHIGFQSYFIHPGMLETIDKLRFDCVRVGKVKEAPEDVEPMFRNSHFMGVDISAIQHAHAPANQITPNGFTGEEMCVLMQYAGMSASMETIGLYGYDPKQDTAQLTAKQLAHMLWYLIDGVQRGKVEASLEDRESFNEFTLAFAEAETVFLQSRKTGRWWVQLPDGNFIACTKNDYLHASSNDIPERWLRAIERM